MFNYSLAKASQESTRSFSVVLCSFLVFPPQTCACLLMKCTQTWVQYPCHALHWIPVHLRFDFQILMIVFKSSNGLALTLFIKDFRSSEAKLGFDVIWATITGSPEVKVQTSGWPGFICCCTQSLEQASPWYMHYNWSGLFFSNSSLKRIYSEWLLLPSSAVTFYSCLLWTFYAILLFVLFLSSVVPFGLL